MDKIKLAIAHVKQFHSEVSQVVFDSDYNWYFSDSKGEFNYSCFHPNIDFSVLKDAADSAYFIGVENIVIKL